MRRFFNRRTVFLTLLTAGALAFFMLILCDRKVERTAQGKTYTDIATVPHHTTGLLLGVSQNLGNGMPNPYFLPRVEAAAALYKAGKIHYLIVSGDNSRADYNEPASMKAELEKRGINPQDIYLDYAGFRTYDSMIRARDIFGQIRLLVISQQFHNERAIYLGEALGMQVTGFNARDVTGEMATRTDFREKFARVNAWLDILTGKKPHFEGPPVKLGT